MKWVLLFFCIIIVLLLMIIFSSIKLNVKKFKILNVQGTLERKLEKDILIYLEFYLLGIIKIAKIKVTNEFLKKMKIRADVKELEKEAKSFKFSHIIEVIKKFKLKLQKVDLNLSLGIDSVVLTSYLVAIISSVLRHNYSKG